MQDTQTDVEGIWKFVVQTFTVMCSLICHSQPLCCLQGLKNPWTEAVASLLTLYQRFAIPIVCQLFPGVWYLSLAFTSLAQSWLCKWEHIFLILLGPGKSCFKRTGEGINRKRLVAQRCSMAGIFGTKGQIMQREVWRMWNRGLDQMRGR